VREENQSMINDKEDKNQFGLWLRKCKNDEKIRIPNRIQINLIINSLPPEKSPRFDINYLKEMRYDITHGQRLGIDVINCNLKNLTK
jgi:hypothetical protein